MEDIRSNEPSCIALNSMEDHFLNIPLTDVDIRRESIPILDLSTSFGRESLGILKLGCELNTPDLWQQNFSLSAADTSYNVLDEAFMMSSRRASNFTSTSTYSIKSSNFSFNLRDLDQPSSLRSYDVSSSLVRDGTNKLNDGFLYTTNSSVPLLEQLRSRFHSVPTYVIDGKSSDDEKYLQQILKRVSEGCQMKMNKTIAEEKLTEENNTFNDSVFIEARHLTSKFSQEGSNDGFILDETDPPELINGDLEESNCDAKSDKGDILKKLDILLPTNTEKYKGAPIKSETQSSASDQIKTIEKDKQKQFIRENVLNGISKNDATSTPTDLKKSREIFKNLSEILFKDSISNVEVEHGQDLLHTLANMLDSGLKKRSKSFVDSTGDSDSIDGHTMKQLGKSINSNTLKSKFPASLGRSTSFDRSNNKSTKSTASESSVEVKNFSLENLKPKKMSIAPNRRGPLKATIPVENFNNNKRKETPPKIQQTLPKLTSRISTPIRAPMKPMAQSTPDSKVPSTVMDQQSIRSFSSSNIQDKSSNYSNSGTSLSSYKDSSFSKDRSSLQKSNLPRRNSVSEVKRSPLTSNVKRSSSMRESGLMKTLSKIRQNISGSAGYVAKSALRDCSNLSEKESSKNNSSKISDVSRRMVPTFGKENTSLV